MDVELMQGHPQLWQTISALCYPTAGMLAHTHTHTENWLCVAGEIAHDGGQGWSWVESDWWSDCDHSVAEMLFSSISLITSSLGFIFVLELILNIPLCSLFITYCPQLLASSFITGHLSHTSFLSVTLVIVWQGFLRLALSTQRSLTPLCNENLMLQTSSLLEIFIYNRSIKINLLMT